MTIIQNPGKEFERTPETFNAQSRITDVETRDKWSGIILDSLDELIGAINVFGNFNPEERTQFERRQVNDAIETFRGNKEFEGAAAALTGLAQTKGHQMNQWAIEDVVGKARSGLESEGRFEKNYGRYFPMGTNFCWTTIKGRKQEDKYILKICVPYIEDRYEIKLAEVLEKPRALVYSEANAKLSIVDDWWFNVNLKNVLRKLPVSKRQLRNISKSIARVISEKRGLSLISENNPFKYEGQRFSLEVGLDVERYLSPYGSPEFGSEYLQVRGVNIVGGAWTTWDEVKGKHSVPKVVQPSIVLTVSMPGSTYWNPIAAVAEDQVKAMQGARDYLTEAVRAKSVEKKMFEFLRKRT